MPANSKTGHEGFDFWMDEYSNCIQEIEDSLHVRSTTPSITNSKRQQTATMELLNRAEKVLKSLTIESQTVPDGDPALRQELVDICKACEMQLETYQNLCRQTDLFKRPASGSTTSFRTPKTAATVTDSSSSSESSLRSSLFATSSESRSARANLLSNTSGHNEQQRRIQAKTQDRVLKQNDNIQAALNSIKETEQVAMGITGELQSQREKLRNTKGSLNQFSSMTQHAKGLLKSMNTPWWQKW